MIYLYTGLPGAGKTLRTIYDVKKLSEAENRPVYYHGIKDLTLPWIPLESPTDWNTCPEGSIIVIDECQSTFRPRANGSQVPKYVADFETHRHKGLDAFLITQHPMLLDGNVRRLVGKHRHLVRAFGFNRAYVHEYQQVRDNVDKNKKDSLRTSWNYPKEVFSYYKSAEVHTVKSALPTRIKLLLLAVPLFLVCVYFAYQKLHKLAHPEALNTLPSGMVSSPDNFQRGKIVKANYLESMKPIVPDLPFTAPRYENLIKPVTAPRLAACVASKTRCKCYTQQATAVDVDDALCRQVANGGIFTDFAMNDVKDKPQSSTQNQSNPSIMPTGARQGVSVAPASVDVAKQERIPKQS